MKSKNMIEKIFLCCIILLFTFLSTSTIAEYDNQELELSELSETEEKIYFPMTDTMAFYGTESEYKKFQEGMNQKEINQGENSNSEFETKNSSNMHVVGSSSFSGYETKIEDNELANPMIDHLVLVEIKVDYISFLMIV